MFLATVGFMACSRRRSPLCLGRVANELNEVLQVRGRTDQLDCLRGAAVAVLDSLLAGLGRPACMSVGCGSRRSCRLAAHTGRLNALPVSSAAYPGTASAGTPRWGGTGASSCGMAHIPECACLTLRSACPSCAPGRIRRGCPVFRRGVASSAVAPRWRGVPEQTRSGAGF